MKIITLVAAAALFATPALAADAIVYSEPAPVVADTFSWSGGYIGIQAGYAWGDSRFEDSFPEATNPFDVDGASGGLTVGYNYQLTPNWVLGAEADLSFADIKGSFGPGDIETPSGYDWWCGDSCVTEVQWYGTARARLGYAFDNVLLYGTGGLAVGRVQSYIKNDSYYSVDDTNVGWAAGAGVEYAFAKNWTTKLEYMHVDLGWTGRNTYELRSDVKFDTVRVGVNYKF